MSIRIKKIRVRLIFRNRPFFNVFLHRAASLKVPPVPSFPEPGLAVMAQGGHSTIFKGKVCVKRKGKRENVRECVAFRGTRAASKY